MPWFKGNLHTHTNKSDGDSSPETVVDWYSNNKYDFLVLSDHNHLTILDSDQTKLLLIPCAFSYTHLTLPTISSV